MLQCWSLLVLSIDSNRRFYSTDLNGTNMFLSYIKEGALDIFDDPTPIVAVCLSLKMPPVKFLKHKSSFQLRQTKEKCLPFQSKLFKLDMRKGQFIQI